MIKNIFILLILLSVACSKKKVSFIEGLWYTEDMGENVVSKTQGDFEFRDGQLKYSIEVLINGEKFKDTLTGTYMFNEQEKSLILQYTTPIQKMIKYTYEIIDENRIMLVDVSGAEGKFQIERYVK